MLLKFRLLRSPDSFLKPCLVKTKEEISKSTSALDSLVVEISESRPFSSNSVPLVLVVVCPSASLVGLVTLVSSSSFNHSSWLQCYRGSLSANGSCSTLNLWVPPDFRLSGFLEDENGQEVFLGFRPNACDERTRSRTVRVHK